MLRHRDESCVIKNIQEKYINGNLGKSGPENIVYVHNTCVYFFGWLDIDVMYRIHEK